MDWYLFALLALVFYAFQGLLFKLAANKKCDNNLTTLYFLLTVTIISIPVLFFNGIIFITTLGIIAAIINGTFYAVTTVTRIGTLKFVPASIVYPIIRLNNAVVALFLILILKERITLENSIGIILAMISIYFLSKGEKK